jgi:uncharacterized protein
MKFVFISTIRFYQVVISGILRQLVGVDRTCRYQLSCSAYAIAVIQQYGVARGSVLTMKRLVLCNPFIS